MERDVRARTSCMFVHAHTRKSTHILHRRPHSLTILLSGRSAALTSRQDLGVNMTPSCITPRHAYVLFFSHSPDSSFIFQHPPFPKHAPWPSRAWSLKLTRLDARLPSALFELSRRLSCTCACMWCRQHTLLCASMQTCQANALLSSHFFDHCLLHLRFRPMTI